MKANSKLSKYECDANTASHIDKITTR